MSKSTYFTFRGKIYEQIDDVTMGSPLSSIKANLNMKHFEKKAIESYPLKQREWRRFVNDTNFIWPHGKESLDKLFIVSIAYWTT